MRPVVLAGVLGLSLTAGTGLTTRAGDDDRPPDTYLKLINIYKQVGSKPKNAPWDYARGQFHVWYDGHDRCSFDSVNFLTPKYHWTFGTSCQLKTGDVVGLLGGVFRADFSRGWAQLERIADDRLPKGAQLPRWDSITAPFPGYASLGGSPAVYLKVLDPARPVRDGVWLELTIRHWRKPSMPDGPPFTDQLRYARVKAGDVVLLPHGGHRVRAIVPPEPASRVVGWVELSPHPLAEANLVRDKRTFVRPTEEKPAPGD